MFAWRTAPRSRAAAALAVILGGAAANLADRAADGQVTDHLATGWWPTFSLADVFIVCGRIAFVALSWRRRPRRRPASNRLTNGGEHHGGPRSLPVRVVPAAGRGRPDSHPVAPHR
ncbi:signal peptidase II [Streptomyces cyaneofuscatus]|uniref:signal peptidase II n=1 Tax=Streptomyces cyaneofuscatus TaxID=66883 RepID=UPI003790EAB0